MSKSSFLVPSFLFRKGAPQPQGPPLIHLCIPQLRPWNVTLIGKRISADIIRGLEMRPSWVRMGPKSNDSGLIRERTWRHKHREGHTKVGTEAGDW